MFKVLKACARIDKLAQDTDVCISVCAEVFVGAIFLFPLRHEHVALYTAAHSSIVMTVVVVFLCQCRPCCQAEKRYDKC